MLIQCPVCSRDISDAAKACPHCGHPLQTIHREAPIIRKKTATFQFIAIATILIALLTPKIIASIPCIVIIIAGIISLARKETRAYISIISIMAGLFIIVSISADLAKIGNNLKINSSGVEDKEYIDKMELAKWEWKVDRYDYSYIKGRVKNIGLKTVYYFKITARYMDKEGNVIDSAYTNSGEELLPGMSKAFEIMHKHSSEYKKANIFVSEVRAR